jgi:tryptophanase
MDYVIEVIGKVWARREDLGGFRFTYQAEALRHFTAQFEPMYSLG